MKNFNLLRKSERKSVGTTLALTVGSPSFDRRYSRLKHYAFMLLFLLAGVGQVWGEVTYQAAAITSTSELENGAKYIILQDGYVLNNSVNTSSQALTTNSYNTTGLAGTESYVWILEASDDAWKLKSAAETTKYMSYQTGSNKGKMSYGTTGNAWTITYASSKWKFVDSENRFLGYTNSTNHVYKTYANSNYNSGTYPNKISLLKLSEEATPKTLTGVSVSGTPTKTSYYAGDDFDPTGLTVTGTYSDATSGPIVSGITWAYNPSQTLVQSQTSIGVTATVNEITSSEFIVTGLSVAAAPVIVSAIEDIEDGASYYIRGVRSSGSVVEYLKFTDGTKGATISGTSASSMDQAIAITFNKVSDGVYQLVTPKGLYVQPGASNGKISLSESATTCTLSNTTKSWDKSATIAISTVDGSDT